MSGAAPITSCQDIRTQFILCIQQSDCIKQHGFHTCVKLPELDVICSQWRRALFDCKRGQMDMRKTIHEERYPEPRLQTFKRRD